MHPKCTPAERLLTYEIDPITGCWNWSGAIMAAGYGSLTVNGATAYAHRFSYEQVCDPIPAGWHIHHRCRNRRCIRPDHLEALSPADHAERHSHLSRLDRDTIRGLAQSMPLQDIASAYGISHAYASRIALGRDIGIPAPNRSIDNVLTEKQQREIIRLASEMSQRRIAAHLAIGRSQVRAILARHGMARR